MVQQREDQALKDYLRYVEAMVFFSESIALAVVRGTSSYPNRIKTPTNYPCYS
jgi:predicted lipase